MKFIYMDTNNSEADWIKSSYDLGFQTLDELAEFLGVEVNSEPFKLWLKNANSYPWVDNAPTQIRVAIRALKEQE